MFSFFFPSFFTYMGLGDENASNSSQVWHWHSHHKNLAFQSHPLIRQISAPVPTSSIMIQLGPRSANSYHHLQGISCHPSLVVCKLCLTILIAPYCCQACVLLYILFVYVDYLDLWKKLDSEISDFLHNVSYMPRTISVYG